MLGLWSVLVRAGGGGRQAAARTGPTCHCHHPGPREAFPIPPPSPQQTPFSLQLSPVSPWPAPHNRSSETEELVSSTRTHELSHKDTRVAGTVFPGPGGPTKCPSVTSLATPPGGQPGSSAVPPHLPPHPPPSVPCPFCHPLPSMSY